MLSFLVLLLTLDGHCISKGVLITTRTGGGEKELENKKKETSQKEAEEITRYPSSQLDQPSYNTPIPLSTPIHPPPHSLAKEIDGLFGSARGGSLQLLLCASQGWCVCVFNCCFCHRGQRCWSMWLVKRRKTLMKVMRVA